VERFIRSLKEECVWQHRFESISHAREVIGQWIRHYNTERPHQALGYQCACAISRVGVQKTGGHYKIMESFFFGAAGVGESKRQRRV